MSNQPYQIMQFLRDINISDGKIADKNAYTPNVTLNQLYMMDTRVSKFSKSVYKLVKDNNTFTYDYSQTIDGIIPFFNELNKNVSYRPLYLLFQSVILESFSMVYMIENGLATVKNFTESDMSRVHENINRIISALYYTDIEGAYNVIIELRALDSNILYMFTTFSGLDYKISDSDDNLLGKLNAIPDSEFNYLSKFYESYDNYGNYIDINTCVKKVENGDSSYLVYNGEYEYVKIRTKVIPMYSESKMTIRANTKNPISIYATDKYGNKVTSFVDDKGFVVRDGLIGETHLASAGVQTLQGFTIPAGISYIVIEITLGKATSSMDDRVSFLMLTSGYRVGEYVPGVAGTYSGVDNDL